MTSRRTVGSVTPAEVGDTPLFREGEFRLESLPSQLKQDVKLYVAQRLVYLLEMASQAVDVLGESHRGFRVGAAIEAYNPETGMLGTIFGGNFTPYKGAKWNCAEKHAFEKAEDEGYTHILAIGVVGPAQSDSKSGVVSPTLHPCHRCRTMIKKSQLVTPDTLIATATPDRNNHELFTPATLFDLHEEGLSAEFPDEWHPLLRSVWRGVERINELIEQDIAERETLKNMGKH